MDGREYIERRYNETKEFYQNRPDIFMRVFLGLRNFYPEGEFEKCYDNLSKKLKGEEFSKVRNYADNLYFNDFLGFKNDISTYIKKNGYSLYQNGKLTDFAKGTLEMLKIQSDICFFSCFFDEKTSEICNFQNIVKEMMDKSALSIKRNVIDFVKEDGFYYDVLKDYAKNNNYKYSDQFEKGVNSLEHKGLIKEHSKYVMYGDPFEVSAIPKLDVLVGISASNILGKTNEKFLDFFEKEDSLNHEARIKAQDIYENIQIVDSGINLLAKEKEGGIEP